MLWERAVPQRFTKTTARWFDVTPRTLRYYEYIELLQPEREGRSRFYGARELARMTLIMRARKFGFQLEEPRQWLEIYEQAGTQTQLKVFVDMADSKLLELQDQEQQLKQTIEDLKGLRQQTLQEMNKFSK